jgi:hypothetical protein
VPDDVPDREMPQTLQKASFARAVVPQRGQTIE